MISKNISRDYNLRVRVYSFNHVPIASLHIHLIQQLYQQ